MEFEGCEDLRDQDVIVAHVEVESLTQRESVGIVVERRIDGRVGRGDVLLVDTSNDLLEVADSLCTA